MKPSKMLPAKSLEFLPIDSTRKVAVGNLYRVMCWFMRKRYQEKLVQRQECLNAFLDITPAPKRQIQAPKQPEVNHDPDPEIGRRRRRNQSMDVACADVDVCHYSSDSSICSTEDGRYKSSRESKPRRTTGSFINDSYEDSSSFDDDFADGSYVMKRDSYGKTRRSYRRALCTEGVSSGKTTADGRSHKRDEKAMAKDHHVNHKSKGNTIDNCHDVIPKHVGAKIGVQETNTRYKESTLSKNFHSDKNVEVKDNTRKDTVERSIQSSDKSRNGAKDKIPKSEVNAEDIDRNSAKWKNKTTDIIAKNEKMLTHEKNNVKETGSQRMSRRDEFTSRNSRLKSPLTIESLEKHKQNLRKENKKGYEDTKPSRKRNSSSSSRTYDSSETTITSATTAVSEFTFTKTGRFAKNPCLRRNSPARSSSHRRYKRENDKDEMGRRKPRRVRSAGRDAGSLDRKRYSSVSPDRMHYDMRRSKSSTALSDDEEEEIEFRKIDPAIILLFQQPVTKKNKKKTTEK